MKKQLITQKTEVQVASKTHSLNVVLKAVSVLAKSVFPCTRHCIGIIFCFIIV